MNSYNPIINTKKIVETSATEPKALAYQDAATPQSVYDYQPTVLARATIPPNQRSKPNGVPTDDELSVLSPKEAADWYRRLAETIRKQQPNSLSAAMMIHWLDGRGTKFIFDSAFVKDIEFVNEYLKDEVRPVLLTEKKARLGGREKWVGILVRIKDPSWDGKPKKIFYEGPSLTMPLSIQAKAKLGLADKAELDLFMSLHNFGIQTEVVISVLPINNSAKYNVNFDSWESWVIDKYDWDPTKFITVPNPDFGNPLGVTPKKQEIRVYHTNAKRVESSGLAQPYDVQSKRWRVTRPDIIGPAVVDSSRKL